MVAFLVDKLSVWCCILALTGLVCGYIYVPSPSYGNMIEKVEHSRQTVYGDVKSIYSLGGCVNISGTGGQSYVDIRLYPSDRGRYLRPVKTVLLYLPRDAAVTDVKVTSGQTYLKNFSEVNVNGNGGHRVYLSQRNGISASTIRVSAARRNEVLSICFMRVYDVKMHEYCDCGDECNRNADVICSGICLKVNQSKCNMVNVALNKPANMSSSHLKANASYAVNGITGTSFSAEGYNTSSSLWNCIHTSATDSSPNWNVDLKESYTFKYVTIYLRSTARDKMKGVRINVDSKLCKVITQWDVRNEKMDLECSTAMTGRYVTLTKDTSSLQFCEIQIWVCKPGFFGTRCETACNGHCGGGDACNVINGTCPGECEPGWYTAKCSVECGKGCTAAGCDRRYGDCECQPGWYNPQCNVECSPGCTAAGCNKSSGECSACRDHFAGDKCDACDNDHFADDCSQQCGHCLKKDRPCGRWTGYCEWVHQQGRCDAGYQVSTCTEGCLSGWYGIDCRQQCSDGCLDNKCDSVTGDCSCRPGRKRSNSKCTEPCDRGSYGNNCTGTCGKGCRGQDCDKETGVCSCQLGFQPPLCQSECVRGSFGQNCTYQCGEGCEGDHCDNEDGRCTCGPGFKPRDTHCRTPCDDGYHGNNCSTPCGNCAKNPPNGTTALCNKNNGHCPNNECDQDFMPPLCAERFSEYEEIVDGGDSTTPIIIVVIIVFVLAILAVIGFFVFRHHRRSRDSPGAKHRPLEAVTRESPQDHIEDNVHFQPGLGDNDGAVCRIAPMTASKRDEEQLLDMDDMEQAEVAEDERWSVYQSIKVALDPVQQHLLDTLTDLEALKAEFKELPAGMRCLSDIGGKEENKAKNRFKKLIAYDHSRVSLTVLPNTPDSDYINANYIRNLQDEQAYIATQGALALTVGDFWRMVWQENVTQIVMLTNLQEKEKTKCHQYWPEKGHETKHLDLTVKGTDVQLRADFFVRSFLIHKGKKGAPREVKQYHMVTWPDHGVPSALALVNLLRCVNSETKADSGPLLVHCSAGVGRTGTYLALDMIMKQSNLQRDNLDVFKTAKRMREDRVIMIQNVDQYVFLYEALLEAYTSRGTRYKDTDLNSVFPGPVNTHTENRLIDQEFSKLRQMQNFLSKPKYTMALLEENKAKNRDRSVLADDAHLLYLSVHVAGRNQYINAVSLPAFRQQRGMLLTQLPLSDTMVDLWRLVVGFDVATIVSLGSKEEEKKKDYCHYWSRADQATTKAGPYVIKTTSSEKLGETLTSYNLTVERTGKETREVNLLHMSCWAGETPENKADLLHLLGLVDTILSKAEDKPIIIQCRDGAKRSGLFAALTNIISRLTYDRQLDVYLTVREVQHVRPQAFTSKAQYRFCYEVALEYKKTFDIYANT